MLCSAALLLVWLSLISSMSCGLCTHSMLPLWSLIVIRAAMCSTFVPGGRPRGPLSHASSNNVTPVAFDKLTDKCRLGQRCLEMGKLPHLMLASDITLLAWVMLFPWLPSSSLNLDTCVAQTHVCYQRTTLLSAMFGLQWRRREKDSKILVSSGMTPKIYTEDGRNWNSCWSGKNCRRSKITC